VSHGSAATVSRYGLSNLGGWAELSDLNISPGTSNGFVVGIQAASPLVFGTGNAERMRIDGSGNVTVDSLSGGGIVTSASGVLGVTPAAGVDTTAIHSGAAAGGDLANTYPNPSVVKIQGNAVSSATPVVGSTLRWSPSGSPSWLPFNTGLVYPEDYGAAGDGSSDDTTPLNNAVAACTGGKILILTQSYAISSRITMSCSVWGTPGSSIVPTSGYTSNVNAVKLTGASSGSQYQFGGFFNFSGVAVEIACSVAKITIQLIKGEPFSYIGTSAQGVGVLFATPGTSIDNEVEIIFAANLVDVFKYAGNITSGIAAMQGNSMRCQFADTNVHGLNFDGSINCDSNDCTFVAWDSGGVSGTSQAFYWSNTSGASAPFSNWLLSISDWEVSGGLSTGGILGGNATPAPMQFSRLVAGTLNNSSAWDLINVTSPAGGNAYITQALGGFTAFGATWQSVANNRSAYSSSPLYFNGTHCTGTIPSGGIGANATLTTYVYSPFALDPYSWVYSAIPLTNLGLVLSGVAFGTNPNEIILSWRNVSGASISSGTTFNFIFKSGIL
jgi:hypothetical protein